MAHYSKQIISAHLNNCDNGANNQIKGKALEDLADYLFVNIPGIPFTKRNEMNAFHTEEIDLALWNDKTPDGLHFLPNIVLIECKNWTKPVSSVEVSWFCQKLQSKGFDFGILIANYGVTGDKAEITAAQFILATHLSQKRTVIVITRDDIDKLITTEDLIQLIKEKLCLLAVGGGMS